jgi:hypothetical protein
MNPAMITFVNDGAERADKISASVPAAAGLICGNKSLCNAQAKLVINFSGSKPILLCATSVFSVSLWCRLFRY